MKTNLAQQYFKKSKDLIAEGKYSDAINELIEAVKIEPEMPELYYEISTICYQLKEYAEAEKYINIALTFNLNEVRYKNRLNEINLKLSSYENNQVQKSMVNKTIKEFDKNNFLIESSSDITQLFMNSEKINIQENKRILAVYDFSVQPYSIGDLLLYIQTTILLNEYYQISKTDFAFILDKKSCQDTSFNNNITEDNVYFHLFSFIQLIQLTGHLGSVYIYESVDEFQNKISNNLEQYYIWPPRDILVERIYLNYFNFQLIKQYYDKGHSMKWLKCPNNLIKWSEDFYNKYVYPEIPVAVNIRQNHLFGQDRNSVIETWVEFFNYCNNKYRAKFIVICGISEIDSRLEDLPNVIIAKNLHTSIEQDMALIQTAACLIGAASGPTAMALFSDIPYYIVNTDLNKHIDLYKGALSTHQDSLKFCFANEFQNHGYKLETKELLIEKFASIWNGVNTEKWFSLTKNSDGNISNLTWLR